MPESPYRGYEICILLSRINPLTKELITVSFLLYCTYLRYSFDTRRIGDFVARLNDTQRIQNVIKQLITATTVDVLGVLISVGFLFFIHGN